MMKQGKLFQDDTFGVARKFLLYNKLAIFKVGETVTLKIANSL